MAKKDLFKNKAPKATASGKALESIIKKNISIVEELKELIPALAEEEFQQLKDNIAKEGVREPIQLWQQTDDRYVIIDGHNRYRVCQELKIDFPISVQKFANQEAVKDWMINNQLGRRNLSTQQASYLRGLLYNRYKQNHGGQLAGENQGSGQNDHSTKKTAEKIAEKTGVGEKTIRRDAKYAEGLEKIGEVNPGLKAQILKGEVKPPKASIQSLASVEVGDHQINSVDDLLNLVDQKPATKKAEPSVDVLISKEVSAIQKRYSKFGDKINAQKDRLAFLEALYQWAEQELEKLK
ncbi:ParB/RepB/Spo0J family partition protein [Persicobacter psychrovividus]|uniref:ParB-like N-terminal domain-containing protein n=1 Tax=Persicobacter psychrovividus TaxID=387638 RepID=A0ABM7VMM1_9BACT|nr:hypothetical protein PEPS_45490 [Persicobacter psychrovividus]